MLVPLLELGWHIKRIRKKEKFNELYIIDTHIFFISLSFCLTCMQILVCTCYWIRIRWHIKRIKIKKNFNELFLICTQVFFISFSLYFVIWMYNFVFTFLYWLSYAPTSRSLLNLSLTTSRTSSKYRSVFLPLVLGWILQEIVTSSWNVTALRPRSLDVKPE